MSPTALRRAVRQTRRHAVVLAWVVALACGITAHHSGMALSGKHHGMDGGSVVELCLGVFTAVGAAVAAITLGSIALAARRVAVRLRPAVAVLAGPPPPATARPRRPARPLRDPALTG